MTHDEALVYGISIAVLSVIGGVGSDHFFMICHHNGMKVRVAICNMIYKKSLRLSQTALLDTAPGKMVNLLSNDVSRFDIVTVVINSIWSAPLSTLLAGIMLWREAQWAGILGLVIVFIVVPFQSKLCAAILRNGQLNALLYEHFSQATLDNCRRNCVSKRHYSRMNVCG